MFYANALQREAAMSDEQRRPDVRRLWQSQADENNSVSIDDLRSKILKMNRIILARTFMAGLAFLIFIGLFGVSLTWKASTSVTNTDIRIAQCIWLIGAGYYLWHLISHLRRAQGKLLTEGEPKACVAFYRSELERQQKSHRRSAVLTPLGLSALCVWVVVAAQHFRVLVTIRDLMIVIWVLVVPFWVYQMLQSARTCQRELDRLNASLDFVARHDGAGIEG
jgi:Flp pilus assembly protein TadB